jgi:hypothetical protein
MPNTKEGALASARRAIHKIVERHKRLPRAVCRLCGGVVGVGQGQVYGEPGVEAERSDRERERAGLPPIRAWTRQHETCLDDSRVVRTLTGLEVSPEVANAALMSTTPVLEGHRRPGAVRPVYAYQRALGNVAPLPWSGGPWSHVSAEDRRQLTQTVREMHQDTQVRARPHACVDGPCGWCGVRLSTGWMESREKWRDGSPAPLCADCNPVEGRRPPMLSREALRAGTLEALTGLSMAGLQEIAAKTIKAYADVADDDHPGTDERWAYAPETLHEIRERFRMGYWHMLKEPLRSQYGELARAARGAAGVRSRQEREAAERAELAQAGWITS